MDRNSAIGLTLIAVLLLAYFYWFSPTPQPQAQKPAEATQPATTQPAITPQQATPSDSTLQATYGEMASAMKGSEAITELETEDLKIGFSNKGGVIQNLELKKFKTYTQQPLRLITAGTDKFSLVGQAQGKAIDLYSLYYQVSQQKSGDTSVVTFTSTWGNASVSQTYRIPQSGYEIGYSISTKGLGDAGDWQLQWSDIITPTEKDLTDTRNNTTITYYSDEEGMDELSPRSSSESEAFDKPLKWIAVKEKFFLSSFITEEGFSAGTAQLAYDPADSSVVKRADIKLTVPKSSLADGNADFKLYFGPNDYQVIGKVTEGFAKNVYLGWPPVYWINKFVIFPVFHFLTKIISNYGLIIIILVVLLKLVLFPLSYKSYLSMAKMKVLKPELDEIKERVGDDMAKVQQEQMKLYQQVGVNPISGCVPVLLQMPILFAMFYLFPASIELRQQPFLWAEDLSTYDSLVQLPFALPFGVGSHISLFTLIMTLATLVYTWQNNQISSVQGPMKSMSYIMPIIFFFFLNSFSTGLTFYYFVSTMITFGQQAVIKRFVDEGKIRAIMEENKKKNAAGGGKKSKFMTKLEEAMKASDEARKRADEERRKRK